MKQLYVQSAIDYIERNIEFHLSVEKISKAIGISQIYLHRLFYTYTGMTLMQYCRKRRLEYARYQLAQNSLVVDVAFKYGFNSCRSFRRAFTNYFRLSPSKAKAIYYQLPNKLNLKQLGGIKMLPYLSKPQVIEMNEIYCLRYVVISKNPEIDVWDFFVNYKQKHNIKTLTEYGFDIPVSEEESKQGLRGYEALLSLAKEDFNNFNGPVVTKKIIPKAKYLSLVITDPFVDPFERIPNGWRKLFNEVKSNYEFNDSQIEACLEEKIEDKQPIDMRLYAPIK
ncbi:helix-turn-helix transcriptional regulator [Clostridium sp. 'deep sea']|uniref:helix-turn-helix domain-containing protein n=1 Tax=Clostridium sp. 'deep sea' TaxID=2779445 RepID=UPI00189697D0|nr:AraC family transcriptional regulator [Clostridium sp. 'deep sea']QOR34227.1 helix-turn-helix transcriptional regulator [Clostridium sp. 'deep sea']